MSDIKTRHVVDSWLATNLNKLQTFGAAIEKAHGWDNQDWTGSFIDIDVGTRIARLTVWRSGTAELQVLCAETSDLLLVLQSSTIDHGTLDQWWSQLRSI